MFCTKFRLRILKNGKAYFILILVVIMLFVVFISNFYNNKCVAETKICEDIFGYSCFEELGMEIEEFNVVKRDTDRKSKYDRIWLDVAAKNDSISYTASYFVEYRLYNDGWVIENIEIIEDDYCALMSIDNTKIEEDLKAIDTYNMRNISVETEIPEVDKTQKWMELLCYVNAENDDMYVTATVEVNYALRMSQSECGWVLSHTDTIDYSYEAKTTPSLDLVSETTSKWSGDVRLLEEKRTNSNECVYLYSVHDAKSVKHVEIDWENTLKYVFDPQKGGWYLLEDTSKAIDVILNVKGKWIYTDEDLDEYVILNVHAANKENVKYDIDFSVVPTDGYWYANETLTKNYNNESQKWTYEYIEDDFCIIFTTAEPIASYYGSWWRNEYYLYYKCYLGEENGKSGFYLDDKLLVSS